MKKPVLAGPFIEGHIAAHGLPRKAVSMQAGLSESMTCRLFNGERSLNATLAYKIGFAAGQLAQKQQAVK